MAVLKLSEIAASEANFTAGDFLLSVQGGTTDVRMSRAQTFGFPTFQLGDPDAASPVAQTLQVQSVSTGTLNTPGVDWIFVGSKGTGTGAGGNILFNLAPAGSTGSTQNTAVQVFKITGGNNALGSPSIQIGSGSATSAGWVLGYMTPSGWAGMWPTAVTPSTSNFVLAAASNAVSINTGGVNDNINFSHNNTAHVTIQGSLAALNLFSTYNLSWNSDTYLSRAAAAILQQGKADAAAPVAQTTQVQSVVAGTSNTAGVDWTFVGSKGTGTGAGGAVVFKTAPAGTTGTSQNAAAEVARLLPEGNIKLTNAANFTANGTTATAVTSLGPAGASTTVVKWLTIVDDGGVTRYIPCF